MQNKPKVKYAKINVNSFVANNYVQHGQLVIQTNKPKQSQFKPKQTQFKPNNQLKSHPKGCLPNLPECLILWALINKTLGEKQMNNDITKSITLNKTRKFIIWVSFFSGVMLFTIKPAPAAASDNFNVRDYGALGDGKTDDTAAFQKALDAAEKNKGGVVHAPVGNYFFAGHLNVPQAVTLAGVWQSVPAHNGIRNRGLPKPTDDGTTFLVTEGAGKEDSPPFITLNTNSTLKGIVLYYPEQNVDDIPKAYPWAIAMRGKNPAVLAVEMLNPYNGIDASRNERHLIRDVHGQPIRRGILVDHIYDIGRIENVHFNPWWSMKPKLFQWQMENGEAFIFGKSDWQYVYNTF
jgi:hypothetical protein